MEIPARNVNITAFFVFLRILFKAIPGVSMTDVCILYETIF